MHDINLFLLKSWLPVGVAAIVFFVIGLLLAKFIWGRFSSRLTNAVEENLNLAGQWSSLGASQRDLFKKLRSRWQADRESWETTISAKEGQIRDLTAKLYASGKTVVIDSDDNTEIKAKVAELEALLSEKDKAISTLKSEVESHEKAAKEKKATDLTVPISPVNALTASAASTESLNQKIKDLEQDLIDTHDELHDVREGYRKQVELVESLEAKLIEAPGSNRELMESASKVADLESEVATLSASLHRESRKGAQFAALFSQRSREISALRDAKVDTVAAEELDSLTATHEELAATHGEVVAVHDELVATHAELAAVHDELLATHGDLEATRKEMVAAHKEEVETLKSTNKELVGKLESEIKVLKVDLKSSESEVTLLKGKLEAAESEIEANVERLAVLEDLERRKASIQSELNDACHEMYDVRTALRNRLDEIAMLEARLDELDGLEAEHETTLQELSDARHELSDVRLAFNEKAELLSKAEAGAEELEAIIADRGAEVNDLSAEVRQQRDLVRQLKNTLAEQEGELEALNIESSEVHSVIAAKTTLLEEHQVRIADLEAALAARYKEMNAIRVESSDHSFAAKYHESRAEQLAAELERRVAIFDESDKRVATAEEALVVANDKIAELTELLASSEASISELRASLDEVSHEKDQKIRDLENASSRVQILEQAAREREEKLSQIEFDLQTSKSEASDFSSRLARITSEIEEARKEQKLSETEVTRLEEALRESDAKTLRLSEEVEAKANELERVSSELSELKEALETKEASAAEAEIRMESLKNTLEAKLKALETENLELSAAAIAPEVVQSLKDQVETLESENSELSGRNSTANDEIRALSDQVKSLESENRELSGNSESSEKEVQKLQREVAALRDSLDRYLQQREESIAEIENLRDKVGRRGDSIRELKGQLSSIMMQRSSREDEISLLKDKLKAVEAELKASDASAKQSLKASVVETPPSVEIDLEEAIKSSLSFEQASDGGTSLDDLGEKQGHHSSPKENESAAVEAPEPVAEDEKEVRGQDDDSAIYFDESAAGLSDSELEKIDHCARLARRSRGKLAVTVIGFAGSEGSADFNESLSARRAEAVRERLLERGVTQSNVHVRNAGQDRRFSDWKARRVELVVAPKAVAETVN
ncbi:OmpA family protein [Verrucomicrobiales bacterium BCK34]|nr:OmpA family protein [Verrucomicrobiales bacterium BCK34]